MPGLRNGSWGWDAGSGAYNRATKEMADEYELHERQREYRANALAAAQLRGMRGREQQYNFPGVGKIEDDYGIIPGVNQVGGLTPPASAPQGTGLTSATNAAAKEAPSTDMENIVLGKKKISKTTPGRTVYANPLEEPLLYGAQKIAPAFFSPKETPAKTVTETVDSTYAIPAAQAAQHRKRLEGIEKYKASDIYKSNAALAASVKLNNPAFFHAMMANESAWKGKSKDSPQGATGAAQVTKDAFNAVKGELRKQVIGDKQLTELIDSLPANLKDCTEEQKQLVGALYMKHMELQAEAKGLNPAVLASAYHAGPKGLSNKIKWWKDAVGQYTPYYTARAVSMANALDPEKNYTMLDVDGEAPTAQVKKEATDVAGVDPTGQYTGSKKQVESKLEALGVSSGQIPPNVMSLLQQRQMLDVRANAAAQTGAFGMHDKASADRALIDAQIWYELANVGAMELEQFGAPQRLLKIFEGYTGNKAKVQLRSDGLLDLYVNGKKATGESGVSPADFAKHIKALVSEQYRSAILATNAKQAEYAHEMLKENLKGEWSYRNAQMNAWGQAQRGLNQRPRVQAWDMEDDKQKLVYDGTTGQWVVVNPGAITEYGDNKWRGAPSAKPIAGLQLPQGATNTPAGTGLPNRN